VVREQDHYGRAIGLVVLKDGRVASYRQVQQGLCWWYQAYAKEDAVLHALHEDAKGAARGLWADPFPVAPWDWRKTPMTHGR
jgi:micrococcal nuclease